jgi:hypothetical protein
VDSPNNGRHRPTTANRSLWASPGALVPNSHPSARSWDGSMQGRPSTPFHPHIDLGLGLRPAHS